MIDCIDKLGIDMYTGSSICRLRIDDIWHRVSDEQQPGLLLTGFGTFLLGCSGLFGGCWGRGCTGIGVPRRVVLSLEDILKSSSVGG